MISNHCLLLTQHDKQLVKSDENEKLLELYIVDGFPPKRVILKNYSMFIQKLKTIYFIQNWPYFDFQTFRRPLLNLTILTVIYSVIGMEM